MKHWRIFFISILITLTVSLAYGRFGKTEAKIAPLLTGMGNNYHAITTKPPSA